MTDSDINILIRCRFVDGVGVLMWLGCCAGMWSALD
jgi:hypothetical protein